jgi:phenylalanyl-tRNA synthetase beta chain
MKVSLKWLLDYVDITVPLSEVCDKLTMAGLEVAGIKTVGGWKNVVVGQIIAVNPHPNADRLRLATVDLGGKQQTVVCGAPNLAIGDKIAFAFVEAELIDGHTGETVVLKSAKIRGILSEGMICSEKELGISESHQGILVLLPNAPVGMALTQFLGDTILDVEVTPNRPDCLSVIGIAREIAAQIGVQIHIADINYKEAEKPISSFLKVEILQPVLCPRYCASLLTNVKLGPSPEWMQQRLIACGMRPINNVVDITNYVMLEYGQPLHAFDYEQISDQKIIVRRANKDEVIKTLDGVDRPLTENKLVIADGKRAMAVAGIMGGEGSEVTSKTNTVVIESANFNQAVIHRGAMDLKLASEASTRFEKGLSLELPMVALKRATQLMQEITGARVAQGIIDEYPGAKTQKPVSISTNEVNRILGIAISIGEIQRTLECLEFHCHKSGDKPDEIIVDIPWWRTDISCTVDLVEEVTRIIGYNNIPTSMLSSALPTGVSNGSLKLRQQIAEIMVGCGFQEVLNYSLTNKSALQKIAVSDSNTVEPLYLANPMSQELECLRTTLRVGILGTIARNLRFQQKNITIFELGKIFIPRIGELPQEINMLCAAIYSGGEQTHWQEPLDNVDFFTAKGVVETLLSRLGLSAVFAPCDDSGLSATRSANILVNSMVVGVLGEVNKKILNYLDIAESVLLIEINVEKIENLVESKHLFKSLPKYPAIIRDLALVVDEKISYQQLSDLIKSFPLVNKVGLFDLYRGEQVSAGKKSLAFRISFQSDEHTLTDVEADKIQKNILSALSQEFQATLRI